MNGNSGALRSFQSGPESVVGKYVHQEAVDVVCLTFVALVKGSLIPRSTALALPYILCCAVNCRWKVIVTPERVPELVAHVVQLCYLLPYYHDHTW